jgi:hypothetical protein
MHFRFAHLFDTLHVIDIIFAVNFSFLGGLNMQAEKILLETDQNGRLLQQPQLPPNVRIEAIFLLLEDKAKGSETIRKPSKKIMGKGKIIGDLKAPVVPPEDWKALQ